MIDVRRLLVLREVARSGSFTAAARALGYSQSAVSQQIAALERATPTPLIERRGRGIRLTDAGRALVRRSDAIVAELAAADAELNAIASGQAGRVRVSVFASAAISLVPVALAAFRDRHPAAEPCVELVELPDDAIGRVGAGDADVALLVWPGDLPAPTDGRIRLHHLLADPLLAVLPRGHALTARRTLRLDDLADQQWVLGGGRGCPDRELIIRACRGAGFDPDVAMIFPTDDYTAIQGVVAAGIGVTLLPRLALAYPRDDIAVRALDGATPYRTVMAAHLADARSPLVEAVLDALTSAASAEE